MNGKCIKYSLAALCISPMIIGAGLMIFSDNEDVVDTGSNMLAFTPVVWTILELIAVCYSHCHIDHHDNDQVVLANDQVALVGNNAAVVNVADIV
jgi:hypothetical protein